MWVRLTIATLMLAATAISAQERAPHVDSIRKAELRADLFFLAGDGLRGRLTNTPENSLASEWVKARFERLGLSPLGDEQSYFHRYNLLTSSLGESNALQLARAVFQDDERRFSKGADARHPSAERNFLLHKTGDRFYEDSFAGRGHVAKTSFEREFLLEPQRRRCHPASGKVRRLIRAVS